MVSQVSFPADVERDEIGVFVRTNRRMTAREASQLLNALNRSFASHAFQKTRRRGFRLEIVSTGTGSWWVLLLAAHEVVNIAHEYPDLVPLFMNDLGQVIKILMEVEPGDTPKHLRDLARSIARTGKRVGAEMIELVNIVQVAIDPIGFEMIDRPEPKRHRPIEVDVPELDWMGLHPRLTKAGALAEKNRLKATLHKVGERWYANAEGMHDVLLPLKLSVLARLTAVDGASFTVKGTVEYSSEGHPIGIEVESLTRNPPDPGVGLLT